jgi:hypothetical protein
VALGQAVSLAIDLARLVPLSGRVREKGDLRAESHRTLLGSRPREARIKKEEGLLKED